MTAASEAGALDFIATGDGPGVLLIHGTGADAESNWGALREELSGRRRLVAPNLPGAGNTPPATDPIRLETLVEELLTAADRGGIEGSFDLVGHSLGAVLAVAVAARAPDRVRSLFLHAGWLRSEPRERLMFDLWARLLAEDSALLARTLVLTAMSPELLAGIGAEELDELVAGFESLVDDRIAGQIEFDARVDISGLAPQVKAPTLVVASADDQILPPHHQQALAKAIVGAGFREIPGGHGIPFEDPGRFAEMVVGFLDSQARKGATDGRPDPA